MSALFSCDLYGLIAYRGCLKTRSTKGACKLIRRGNFMLGTIALWFAAFASVHAGWTLQSSERMETASSAIKFVRKTITGDRDVEIHTIFFDIRNCDLRVIDHPGEENDLAAAMLANHCLAGVNGNYFHPDRTSLGLGISDGLGIHAIERAKLLSGVLAAKPGHFSLLRFAEFKPEKSITCALQAGPFLIDKGEVVPGLEATRIAKRTVVLSDGKTLGALLVCHSATLAEMAAILATPGNLHGKCTSPARSISTAVLRPACGWTRHPRRFTCPR